MLTVQGRKIQTGVQYYDATTLEENRVMYSGDLLQFGMTENILGEETHGEIGIRCTQSQERFLTHTKHGTSCNWQKTHGLGRAKGAWLIVDGEILEASVEMITTSRLKTPGTFLFLECSSAQCYMIPSSNSISFHYF